MRTKIGVFFGGRSVEHEISVISALQAIGALDAVKYEAVPVYITKQGRWFTGPALLDPAAYRDMAALERRATEVYMLPEYGERALWRKKRGLLAKSTRKPVATLDIALPVLHGTNGEDGTFQGLMELVGIPYVGCNPLSSAVGMDKIAMKMMLRESGVPVIDYIWFTDRQWGTRSAGSAGGREDGHKEGRDELIARAEKLGYPLIVKPANLGSSVGISRARNREELLEAVEIATGYSSRVIVERMIEPLREINCSVLGSADTHRTSVCEEPLRSGEILSYADKYMSGGNDEGGSKSGEAKGVTVFGGAKDAGISASAGAKTGTEVSGGSKGTAVSGGMQSTKRRIPADLPENTTDEIRRLASETFRVLGCEGVARVDFILDETGPHGNTTATGMAGATPTSTPTVYVNEINTIPGSLSFYLWEATGASSGEAATPSGKDSGESGISFGALLDTIISQALKRERDKAHKTVSYDQNIFSMAPAGSFGGTKGGAKGAKS